MIRYEQRARERESRVIGSTSKHTVLGAVLLATAGLLGCGEEPARIYRPVKAPWENRLHPDGYTFDYDAHLCFAVTRDGAGRNTYAHVPCTERVLKLAFPEGVPAEARVAQALEGGKR